MLFNMLPKTKESNLVDNDKFPYIPILYFKKEEGKHVQTNEKMVVE